MPIVLFVAFVLLAVLFHFAARSISRVRVLQEVALPQESWDQIGKFWEAVRRTL